MKTKIKILYTIDIKETVILIIILEASVLEEDIPNLILNVSNNKKEMMP